jgi:hypothetical protein
MLFLHYLTGLVRQSLTHRTQALSVSEVFALPKRVIFVSLFLTAPDCTVFVNKLSTLAKDAKFVNQVFTLLIRAVTVHFAQLHVSVLMLVSFKPHC